MYGCRASFCSVENKCLALELRLRRVKASFGMLRRNGRNYGIMVPIGSKIITVFFFLCLYNSVQL